jgi:ABC-2 type transport system ATP-binding protein
VQSERGLLAFHAVSKSYGDEVALREVSFDVRPGEVFGLLGPNGAGKTTALRVLMDIVRADSGSVSLFGQPLSRESLDRVGYLPEERGLYTKHKVLDVLVYFGALKGLPRREARRRAAAWLERVGLPDVGRGSVEQLSKGMMQKVQLAGALLAGPELAVLDEPFSGLDPLNAVLVKDLISELKAAGKTTILSTHQMAMVETLCDRVALLSGGKLVVYGEVEEVRRRHSLAEVRVSLAGPLPELAGVERAVDEGDHTWRLLLCEGVDAQQVLHALVAQNARVERFEQVLASMEDIFIRTVRDSTESSS